MGIQCLDCDKQLLVIKNSVGGHGVSKYNMDNKKWEHFFLCDECYKLRKEKE